MATFTALLLLALSRTLYEKKIAYVMLFTCFCFGRTPEISQADRAQQHPNILFIIMDDVGIDQMRSFGYGGVTPPGLR